MEKKMTGYASIDKPWLKYYSAEAINAPLPECTMYEYLFQKNKEHIHEIALEYLGNRITYMQLFAQIEIAAKAFSRIGIKAGDIVPIMAVNMPEVVYSIYGLNRIGAIPNMIDPRTGTKGLAEYIVETKSKVLIALDACHESINGVLQMVNLEHVIVLCAADSAKFPLKHVLRYNNRKMRITGNGCVVSWRSFVRASGS